MLTSTRRQSVLLLAAINLLIWQPEMVEAAYGNEFQLGPHESVIYEEAGYVEILVEDGQEAVMDDIDEYS